MVGEHNCAHLLQELEEKEAERLRMEMDTMTNDHESLRRNSDSDRRTNCVKIREEAESSRQQVSEDALMKGTLRRVQRLQAAVCVSLFDAG